MRNLLGGLVAALWLLVSVLLWAGVVQIVPPPAASHAFGLTLAQAVLLAYHLSGVLQTLAGAYLSLALGGALSGIWLLTEGLFRRMRLAGAMGGAVIVVELALALFAWLRIRLALPMGPNAAGLLAGASIAGQLAAEMIPAALLLVLALGAIVVVGRRGPRRQAKTAQGPAARDAAGRDGPHERPAAPPEPDAPAAPPAEDVPASRDHEPLP